MEAILSLIATVKCLWISIPWLRKDLFSLIWLPFPHCLHMKFSCGYPFPHSVKNIFHSFGYHILTAWKVTEDGSPFPYSVKKIFLSFGGHIITDCYCKMFVDLHSPTQKELFSLIWLPFPHRLHMKFSCGYPFPHSVKNFFHSFGYHILTAWKVTEDGSPFPYSVKKKFFSHLEAILSLIATVKCLWISIPWLRKDLFSLIWLPFPHCLHMKISCGYPFPHSVKNFFHSFGYHILTAWKVTEDGSPFPYSVKKIFLSFGGHIITDCYCKMFVDLHSLTQKRFIFSHLVAIFPLFAYEI